MSHHVDVSDPQSESQNHTIQHNATTYHLLHTLAFCMLEWHLYVCT